MTNLKENLVRGALLVAMATTQGGCAIKNVVEATSGDNSGESAEVVKGGNERPAPILGERIAAENIDESIRTQIEDISGKSVDSLIRLDAQDKSDPNKNIAFAYVKDKEGQSNFVILESDEDIIMTQWEGVVEVDEDGDVALVHRTINDQAEFLSIGIDRQILGQGNLEDEVRRALEEGRVTDVMLTNLITGEQIVYVLDNKEESRGLLEALLGGLSFGELVVHAEGPEQQPTIEPTATVEPTISPTGEPTEEPTAEPTEVVPTETATPIPTETPVCGVASRGEKPVIFRKFPILNVQDQIREMGDDEEVKVLFRTADENWVLVEDAQGSQMWATSGFLDISCGIENVSIAPGDILPTPEPRPTATPLPPKPPEEQKAQPTVQPIEAAEKQEQVVLMEANPQIYSLSCESASGEIAIIQYLKALGIDPKTRIPEGFPDFEHYFLHVAKGLGAVYDPSNINPNKGYVGPANGWLDPGFRGGYGVYQEPIRQAFEGLGVNAQVYTMPVENKAEMEQVLLKSFEDGQTLLLWGRGKNSPAAIWWEEGGESFSMGLGQHTVAAQVIEKADGRKMVRISDPLPYGSGSIREWDIPTVLWWMGNLGQLRLLTVG